MAVSIAKNVTYCSFGAPDALRQNWDDSCGLGIKKQLTRKSSKLLTTY